ncbi:unnamed protein product [Gordionus sp. m RMFG-2023]
MIKIYKNITSLNSLSLGSLRFCSTNFNWNKKHLQKHDGTEDLSWRESPNIYGVPIKRGDIYYPARQLEPYPYKKKFGYRLNWFNGGFLPRVKSDTQPPTPNYKPSDSWEYKKAYKGRNDYIDILGVSDIQHVDLIDKGPYWVRGVPKKWNELQWLIRKDKYIGNKMKLGCPEQYRLMNSRLKHLYYYYNLRLAGREGKYKRWFAR